jgi:hypothetical protein
MWQATPCTLGSSNACTQTLWLEPISFQAVVTQPISSDCAADVKKTPNSVQYASVFFIKIPLLSYVTRIGPS